jgi:uncharacterized membrane protein
MILILVCLLIDKLKSIASILQEAGKIEQYKQILENTRKSFLKYKKLYLI